MCERPFEWVAVQNFVGHAFDNQDWRAIEQRKKNVKERFKGGGETIVLIHLPFSLSSMHFQIGVQAPVHECPIPLKP